MSSAKVTVEAKGERELVISRAFNAPNEMVFKAYTECKYLKRWLSALRWLFIGGDGSAR